MRSARVALLALMACIAGAASANAARPDEQAASDARRFGLNRLERKLRRPPSEAARRAFGAFNAATGGRWKIRFDPRTGAPAALVGGTGSPRFGRPDDAARAFLSSQRALLGVEPATLSLDHESRGRGHRHVLYQQTYRGIPVEFAKVKVHLDDQGAVIGVHSTYEPDLSLGVVPTLTADAALRAAERDARGGRARGTPELVFLPLESDGHVHLAWKVKVDAPAASWRYYVDAADGSILLRYNNLRFAVCQTSGVVSGAVFDIDPVTTPGFVTRPFNNQWVYVADGSTRALTGGDATYGQGFFCSATLGKVSMSLQGPYVNVSEFRGPSAHYDNGSGVWNTVATPVSSPHPYSDSSVAVSTIDLTVSAPSAVEFLPVFSNFQVGGFSGLDATDIAGGDITDDDQVTLYDGTDAPVASYIGNRGSFNGAAVHGQRMHIALKSNSAGQNTGYDIAISSYLALTSPFTLGTPHSSHTWTSADAPSGLRSETNLFYHLNAMHDYFFADVNRSSAAAVVGPVVAMAHVGPNLVNAFYNPDYDNLFFGDVNTTAPNDAFTDDATVSRHEYVHYLVEKIWPIQNFGQAGAISEANADYFSASSLDHSGIGTFVVQALGGTGPLRELDDTLTTSMQLSATSWAGEIHSDSLFLSQALWDIRRNRVTALGATNGRSCADGLVFQSLLFFPESFQEYYDAMSRVQAMGSVAACGGPSAGAQTAIDSAFSSHGLLLAGGDAYEPNDGFETATDISTRTALSATLYPASDADFFSFGAGPGLVQVTLNLPASGSFFKAYQLKLFDRSRQLVASAAPAYNGFGTLDGVCDSLDCTTLASQISLTYNNPTGGLLYLEVVGGDSISGSASGVNSTTPYGLQVAFPQAAALSGGLVSANFDNDAIAFTANVSTFGSTQDWRFAYVQLRNQSYAAMPNTQTHVPTAVGDYLAFVSSLSALGVISGRVQLVPGFATRFPSVGTVYLELFGYDVHGSTSSLGLSNALNLTATSPELKAYNNVFHPLRGEKTTVKYAVDGPGRLTLKVYTVTGVYVSTLFDDQVSAGKGSVDWNGSNFAGTTVASGVYVVRAQGPGLNKTQKIVIVK